MKRMVLIVAGVAVVVVALAALVRFADQSGYGKSAPPRSPLFTVTAELPKTNPPAK